MQEPQDAQPDVEPDQVPELERTHREPEAELDRLVDPGGVATPPMNMCHASFPIIALNRLAVNPGGSATTIVSLSSRSQSTRPPFDRPVVGLHPPPPSDERDPVGGVEEMQADHVAASPVQPAICATPRAEVLVANINPVRQPIELLEHPPA